MKTRCACSRVGVDIGSSTSHLVFSRIVLERLDSRYVVTTRETFYQSDILLTPYSAEETIDADALGAFIERQYKDAKVDPDEIDTGALILTGVAVRRRNARRSASCSPRQAGKMVAVSAGDNLETVMAAYGSGAVARSIRDGAPVMNVDVGGGTSKIAVCTDGRVIDVTAIDVGARLVCSTTRAASCGSRRPAAASARELGLEARARRARSPNDGARARGAHGRSPVRGDAGRLAARRRPRPVAPRSAGGARRGRPSQLLRRRLGIYLRPRGQSVRRSRRAAAAEVRARLRDGDRNWRGPTRRIRATVIGASQYTTQVSGSTIFVSPLETLPLRNVPVIAPALPLDDEAIDSAAVAAAIKAALQAARSRRRRKPGRGVRALARLGDLPPARRFLQGRRRRARSRAGATAIPSCWPATATSAG